LLLLDQREVASVVTGSENAIKSTIVNDLMGVIRARLSHYFH
jgi:hypothetical protein